MARILRNHFGNLLVILVIFSLVTSWFYSGWPQIWQNPPIPPEIQETMASTTAFTATTTATSWTVPTGVYSITVKAWGAGGGGGRSVTSGSVGGGGGGGGFAQATITVTPGATLVVYVGGGGTGGSAATRDGAGGGGLTGVWLTSTSTPFIIAGAGGGGAGGSDATAEDGGPGGGGGGDTGGAGVTGGGGGGNGGGGGLQNDGGAAGTGTAFTDGEKGSTDGTYCGGDGGNIAGGQGGGAAGGNYCGGHGGLGGGTNDSGGGGGGGTGYYGGGGGESGQNTTAGEAGGGGGGGSNYVSGTATTTWRGGTGTVTTQTGGTVANSTDTDYVASAGVGGNGGNASIGNTGQPGLVVITFNTVPTFTGAGPTDDPDPVTAGQIVTFSGTASDPESESWYLVVCKTSWAATTTPPTCAASQDYCVSNSAVASGSSNSCDWTSTVSGSWYAFACDSGNSLGIRCSSASTSDITVNAVTVSITRSAGDGIVSYGTVNLGSSTSTDPAGINDVETFRNTGSGAEQFSIKTENAINGTTWTAVSGTPGANQFRHSFATTSPVTYWKVMGIHPDYVIASSSVAVNGTLDIYLQIEMPSNTGGDYSTKNIKVTVFAEAAEAWTLNEANCNALSGWHWYTTNSRLACWSKTLADTVSWNKGAGDDTDNPGTYTCVAGYTLRQRMEAAAAGEWYKIVSNVAGTNITSSHNGSAGWPFISALAIADCVDGTRDLCTGDGCTGASDWSSCNTYYRNWAGATGNKSALPYLATDAGTTQATNDYQDACVQSGNEDGPLGCTSGNNYFYLNRKVCGDGDANYLWAAACGNSDGASWDIYARDLGYLSCSCQDYNATGYTSSVESFRVAVRP